MRPNRSTSRRIAAMYSYPDGHLTSRSWANAEQSGLLCGYALSRRGESGQFGAGRSHSLILPVPEHFRIGWISDRRTGVSSEWRRPDAVGCVALLNDAAVVLSMTAVVPITVRSGRRSGGHPGTRQPHPTCASVRTVECRPRRLEGRGPDGRALSAVTARCASMDRPIA